MNEARDERDIEASDPLDMGQYTIERLPDRPLSRFDIWKQRSGGPLALISFVLIYFVLDLQFLKEIDPELLTQTARVRFSELGAAGFLQANVAMLAIFVAALILWVTEAVPNYQTSLMVIAALVLTGVLKEVDAFHQLGHKVMWLNILSFVLASMLVKTRVAKRFALWLIVRFGKHASSVFLSFIAINLVLSAFISATTAKAAILLPIFMVIAAIYGARGGQNKNNFGRNLVLQNLFQINMGASGFITGSGANLLAGAMIAGAIGASDFYYSDWLVAALPLALLLILIGWIVGTRIIFPVRGEENLPQIEGGMDYLRRELASMGKPSFEEIQATLIFIIVLALWATDRYHGISKTMVALLAAIVALLPGIGIVKWNDVDIPWHLMLFSAGAYTIGAGLAATDLAAISVRSVFAAAGAGADTPFWALYLSLTALMAFSSLASQSKTMRTLVIIPIAIGVAQQFGYSVMSLAFPVALLIEHVYVLPFNSKPAALLYLTDHYSWTDSVRFGLTMLVAGWLLVVIAGETYLRFLGHTPNGVFGIF